MSDDVLICIFWETFLVRGKMSPQKIPLEYNHPLGQQQRKQHIIPGYNVMHRTLWLTALVICQMTR